MMGRRTLSIASGFLPVLIGEGVHHYSVHNGALPLDTTIVDAVMSPDRRDLILTLESEEWESLPCDPLIEPHFIEHHCLGEDV